MREPARTTHVGRVTRVLLMRRCTGRAVAVLFSVAALGCTKGNNPVHKQRPRTNAQRVATPDQPVRPRPHEKRQTAPAPSTKDSHVVEDPHVQDVGNKCTRYFAECLTKHELGALIASGKPFRVAQQAGDGEVQFVPACARSTAKAHFMGAHEFLFSYAKRLEFALDRCDDALHARVPSVPGDLWRDPRMVAPPPSDESHTGVTHMLEDVDDIAEGWAKLKEAGNAAERFDGCVKVFKGVTMLSMRLAFRMREER